LEPEGYIAKVSEDVADLVPQFLANIRSDLAAVERALAQADFPALRRYGERFHTLGTPYGFAEITQCGRALLKACEQGNVRAVAGIPAQMRRYLEQVRIVVVRSAR
jgi:hypothetical protein